MELHHMSKKWNHQRSPDRTKVWIEPFKQRRVPVVYYLCRNGQLEHPHFVEVPLPSSDGLYLRDVIDRLNSLRGNGMAALYSWSSKRSYKNGFVWHDLSENDLIYPVHGHEYILKGSELFDVAGTGAGASFSSKSDEAQSTVSKKSSVKSVDEFDLHEYKIYSGELSSGRIAANAATQTDDTRRRRRAMIKEVEEEEEENMSSVLSRNEISPPPSDSSPETLESLMKSDGKLIVRSETDDEYPTAGIKLKASSVLMQLITCGSVSFRDCGPGSYGKENPEGGDDVGTGQNAVVLGRKNIRVKKVVTEDKEYFSGSLIETKKDVFPALKRSNSYNADA